MRVRVCSHADSLVFNTNTRIQMNTMTLCIISVDRRKKKTTSSSINNKQINNHITLVIERITKRMYKKNDKKTKQIKFRSQRERERSPFIALILPLSYTLDCTNLCAPAVWNQNNIYFFQFAMWFECKFIFDALKIERHFLLNVIKECSCSLSFCVLYLLFFIVFTCSRLPSRKK